MELIRCNSGQLHHFPAKNHKKECETLSLISVCIATILDPCGDGSEP